MNPRVLYTGDSCLVVEFGNSIDMEINARVQALRREIESKPFRGFIETVPTYRSLTVCFDPLRVPEGFDKLLLRLAEAAEKSETAEAAERKILVVPTCYEEDFAPDIEKVAVNAGITADEVVRRHSARDCYCYMLGFVPGYSYLGGMDPSLETPRLKEPREKIPAGSVAIGGKQTGIYPIESPGGWNLIGKTPLRLFDPARIPAIFLEAGMWVRFVPIDAAEFEKTAVLAALPDWKPDIRAETARKEVG
ncbi:MAG: 5-oxoprolinase subunit PxpB [Synergistaceae bacterium]|jgi:KipI family sensor histidine kinase inhibitor|nr:5-oxoprolinase subunit PxpB [Synergistaceae bacterium]